MYKLIKKQLLFLSLIFLIGTLSASEDEIKTIYHSLDPQSLSEHLAFYKLYSNYDIGKEALNHAQSLLKKHNSELKDLNELPIDILSLDGFVSFMQGSGQKSEYIDPKCIEIVEQLSSELPHKKLKGHNITSMQEAVELEADQIDIARALLVSQQDKVDWGWVKNYEAKLDFMALQVLARMPRDYTHYDLIKAINQMIFFEMGYRFPAVSALKKEAGEFSTLTNVLDSQRGVCLGVSVLYLCLAQRLDLPLEAITPPGHIYVRYNDQENITNIETTARGIDTPSDAYLGINTKDLHKVSLKEVCAFVFCNVGTSLMQEGLHYQKAIEVYKKSLKFSYKQPLAHELIGYAYYITNQMPKAIEHLNEVNKYRANDIIRSNFLDAHLDILAKNTGPEAIELTFKASNDESYLDLKENQKQLLLAVEKYPYFKAGYFFLAQNQLELSENHDALKTLQKLHELDSGYPQVEYFLSQLYLMDYNIPKAWEHLENLENILDQNNHHPRMLKSYKTQLNRFSQKPN